jgi:Sulfatase-modifying factor enzyme 1
VTTSPQSADPGEPKSAASANAANETLTRTKRRRYALLVLFLLVVLGVWVHQCQQDPPVEPEYAIDTAVTLPPQTPAPAETTTTAPDIDTTTPELTKPFLRPTQVSPPPTQAIIPRDTSAADTTTPYIFADPWGGRHFDSVTVRAVCRESCLVLYSLNDTAQFKTYETPLTFRRNTKLWLAGVRDDGMRLPAIAIDYVIERDAGQCPAGMVPFSLGQGGANGANPQSQACIDRYEWPNREDATPQAFVSWREANDSCRNAGKRLCTLGEWQGICAGPEAARYPYAARYDERHCPAKEPGPARSGHFPVCRSYFGTYDMTGNLWEWTSTPHPEREGFFMVAGGNWDAGDQATCAFTRYSFYPQNRFPMVGFRCCADVGLGSGAK